MSHDSPAVLLLSRHNKEGGDGNLRAPTCEDLIGDFIVVSWSEEGGGGGP